MTLKCTKKVPHRGIPKRIKIRIFGMKIMHLAALLHSRSRVSEGRKINMNHRLRKQTVTKDSQILSFALLLSLTHTEDIGANSTKCLLTVRRARCELVLHFCRNR
jgi:hypothetical protein